MPTPSQPISQQTCGCGPVSEAKAAALSLGGHLVVQIQRWERWQLLGTKPRRMPRKYSFQGGLTYSPSFDVSGRIVDPAATRGQQVRIWISPTHQSWESSSSLGQLYSEESQSRGWDISVSLLLPGSATATATTCLASVWNYLQLSTFDEDREGARISAYSFARQLNEIRLVPLH